MKKFLSLAIALLLAISAFALCACNKDNDGTIPGKYEEVEIDTPQQQEYLAETISDKLLANAPENTDETETVQQWLKQLGFELKSTLSFSTDVSVDVKDVKTEFSTDVTAEESVRARFTYSESDGVGFLAEGTVGVKGGIKLPQFLWEATELPAEELEKIKAVAENFDWSASICSDGKGLYAHVNDGVKQSLAQFGAELPSDKVMLPFDVADDPNTDGQDGAIQLPDADVDFGTELKANILYVLQLLKKYNVSVAVSQNDGWALRLKVTEETLQSLLEDENIVPPEVSEVINSAVTFSKCVAEWYIGFDKDNKFVKMASNVDIEGSIDVEKSVTVPVAVSGSFKLSSVEELSLFGGEIALPSDLDKYVDISTLVA